MKKTTLFFVIALVFIANVAFSQTEELAKINWNTENGFPYIQSFDANYGVENFIIINNTSFAFLSKTQKEIIIYNIDDKLIENRIKLNFLPIDFTFNNNYFYVSDYNNLYKINLDGNVISTKRIKDIQFVDDMKIVDDKVYLIDNNQNSFYFKSDKLENFSSIILNKNVRAKINTIGKSSYNLIVSNNNSVITKKYNSNKHLGTVKIIGFYKSKIYIEEQIIVKNVPLKVNRQIVSVDINNYKKSLLLKLPNVNYTYIKHDIKIFDNKFLVFVTTPQSANLYSVDLDQFTRKIKLPENLYNINYHYNNHLIDISSLESNDENNIQTKSTMAAITRSQIISNAEPYAVYSWNCNSNNIKDYDCGGVHVTTPSWVNVGNNISIPYCWGGFSNFAEFDNGIANGVSAGDSYTVGNGSGSSCAVGVDCSGFVSRCWDLPYKYGTSTLPNISTAYSSFDQLKRGDIVNYSGHHVRLVHTVNSTSSFLLIEASASGTDWRVGYNNYTTADLQASYVPRWYVDVVDDPVDTINPTTNVSANNWETANFTASFTDNDNVSINEKFYQVCYYNNLKWKANTANGFFNDNFNTTIDSNWNNLGGSWAISGSTLNQSDETSSNTNLYAFVNQSTANSYLYHFKMKISGSGTNRRGGIYFMSDNPTMTQRNNSYMIYFRADQNTCQIYKSVSDNIELKDEENCNVDANICFDVKIIFNKTSGKITVYKDNEIVATWIDASPLTSGNYISLRTGEANMSYDDIEVYKSRNSSALVSVGISNDAPFDNPSINEPACLISSFVTDSIGNISNKDSLLVNIDTSIPSNVSVNDGSFLDVDTFYTSNEILGNWSSAIDTNSGIQAYSYCIGTSPNSPNIIPWTNNGTSLNIDINGLSLNFDTIYYISVKSINNAGLISNISTSNGQILYQTTNAPVANFYYSDTNICVIDSIDFFNYSNYSTSSYWEFSGGNPATSTLTNPTVYFSSGNHTVKLISSGPGGNDTLIKNITVLTNSMPSSLFTVSDTLLTLPNAYATFTNNSVNSNNYEWKFGDGTSSTDIAPWHLYSNSGYFTVKLISKNDYCPNDTLSKINYVHVLEATNVDDILGSYINLFPIPASSVINIKSKKYKIEKCYVYDIYGNIVDEVKVNNENFTVNVEELHTGIYFLKIQTDKDVIIKKFIKE